MSKCQYCNEEIDYLNVIICQYIVCSTDKQLGVVEELEVRSDEVVHWECPECEEALFYRYEDALKFTRNTGDRNEAIQINYEKRETPGLHWALP